MMGLKDDVIAVLGVICLVLGLGWIISHYKSGKELAELQVNYNAAQSANQTQLGTIHELQQTNQELIAQQKLDQKAAGEAAARVSALSASLEAKLAENAVLREKLAQENPDVRTYLDAGVPCQLVLQLWPEQKAACSD